MYYKRKAFDGIVHYFKVLESGKDVLHVNRPGVCINLLEFETFRTFDDLQSAGSGEFEEQFVSTRDRLDLAMYKGA